MENLPKVRMIICGSCGVEKRWNTKCSKCGRPSQFDKSDYCDTVFCHMASGRSVKGFCKKFNLSRSTFYNWLENYPNFNRAMLLGKREFLLSRLEKLDLSNLLQSVVAFYNIKNELNSLSKRLSIVEGYMLCKFRGDLIDKYFIKL